MNPSPLRTIPNRRGFAARLLAFLAAVSSPAIAPARDDPPVVAVEGQPLAANVQRVAEALDHLGAPLPAELRTELTRAAAARDGEKLQRLLDPRVLLVVHINPEMRVKVARGPAPARLQQAGYTPVLVKVLNESGGTPRLRIGSPQAGPVYAGAGGGVLGARMQQHHLAGNQNTARRADRFLDVEMLSAPPMSPNLSGLDVEYAIASIHSSEAGRREATLTCDAGQGTQDLGFRAEAPVLFDVQPAIAVRLSVQDHDGTPTTGRFLFVDGRGHVFPPQVKRLAPDLFFQKHIYRTDGETVLLPPGEFTMSYGRGPEYRWIQRAVAIPEPVAAVHDRREKEPGAEGGHPPSPSHDETTDNRRPPPPGAAISVKLERWIDPAAHGFYSGDHHIHPAGCAHYSSPTEGVDPANVLRQVKGEGLNLGSVLVWSGGFEHQREFCAPAADPVSEPLTVLKYDIEVSGFGSGPIGHLCLLNLKEHIYPGANGIKDWPTWGLPVLRWVKAQGGVTGYPHTGSGWQAGSGAAKRMLEQFDANKDGRLDPAEADSALLPEPFAEIDFDRDRVLSAVELKASHDRVEDRLPNLAIPEHFNAQEIFVTAAHGVCDFISAMNTDRIREWNAWYHLMNCGFPMKVSGETDFPCLSGTRIGQGRTYVRLGPQKQLDYAQWCEGMAQGRSYVSDGYAHALDFRVNGKTSGDELRLAKAATVNVQATVAFSPETPLESIYGAVIPAGGPRFVGGTVVKREEGSLDPVYQRGQRRVEVVVNGRVAASREVPADGREHAVEFTIPIGWSSWVAVRQFPQLHTNPVNVLVGGRPIRASRASARWALGCIDQLWRTRHERIAPAERAEAERAYEEARAIYRRIAAEARAEL